MVRRVVWFLGLALFLGPAHSEDFKPFGQYATPEGSVLTLRKSGAELAGELTNASSNTELKVVGKNTVAGRIDLNVLNADGSVKSSGQYEIGKRSFTESGKSVSYTTWRKTGETGSSLDEFAAVITAQNSDVPIGTLSGHSLSWAALVDQERSAREYFGSQGISYNADTRMQNPSATQSGSVVAAVDRRDLSPYVAQQWKTTGALPSLPDIGGIRFETTGATDAVVSLTPANAQNILNKAIDVGNNPGTSAVPGLKLNRFFLVSPDPVAWTVRAQLPNQLADAMSNDLAKTTELLRPWLDGFGQDRCKVLRDGALIAVACDYHSSKFGAVNVAWIKTYAKFIPEASDDSSRAYLIIPSSVVAFNFLENDHDKLKPGSFKSMDQFQGSLSLQKAYVEDLVSYLVQDEGFGR